MEGTLRVTPEQLESAAGEFSNKGNTVGNLTSEMTQLVESLSSVWEGDAATAYTSKFRELDDDIQKMIRMIQEHATDLAEMAAAYREAESGNSELIADLAGDVIV